MNRLEFIKSTKSALLVIPIAGILKFDRFDKFDSYDLDKWSTKYFPDKSNYLIEAKCLFATPITGDGKNGDDSYVDAYVDVECYDNLYSAHGGFGDGTDIETNIIREMTIGFSASDAKKIFYDGVKNINITILGHKPNQSNGQNDHWDIRWEFLMQFAKGNILATGYNEPAIHYDYKIEQTPINAPNTVPGRKSYFNRNQLTNHRTLDKPVG